MVSFVLLSEEKFGCCIYESIYTFFLSCCPTFYAFFNVIYFL